MPLPLLPDPIQTSSPGDFGVVVDVDQGVHVPPALAFALRRLAVRNADQFVNFLYVAPSALAAELGWPTDAVLRARDGLFDQLDGVVSDSLLHPGSPLDVSFGANDPGLLKGY